MTVRAILRGTFCALIITCLLVASAASKASLGADANSGWGTAQLIETDAEIAAAPQVAVDGSGNAVAVWEQYDGTRYNIWSNRYVVGAGWGDAELIETDD